MAGVWLRAALGRLTTVAERLKPESLFERFVAYRESLGFEIFPLTGGEQPPFVELSRRLRENKIVCLMGERDLAESGVPVTFFGEPTRMPAGPAEARDRDRRAAAAGALLVHVDGGWGFGGATGSRWMSPGGVAAATQALADRFAANIAAHPADWHMLQPLWETDLSEARLARMENA